MFAELVDVATLPFSRCGPGCCCCCCCCAVFAVFAFLIEFRAFGRVIPLLLLAGELGVPAVAGGIASNRERPDRPSVSSIMLLVLFRGRNGCWFASGPRSGLDPGDGGMGGGVGGSGGGRVGGRGGGGDEDEDDRPPLSPAFPLEFLLFLATPWSWLFLSAPLLVPRPLLPLLPLFLLLAEMLLLLLLLARLLLPLFPLLSLLPRLIKRSPAGSIVPSLS